MNILPFLRFPHTRLRMGLWLCMMGLGLGLSAQVQVTIALTPPYPIHVDDYLKMGDFAALTLINQSNSPQNVKLIPSIKSDDGKSARVKPGFKPTRGIELAAFQSRTLTAYELLALNANLSADFISQEGFNREQIIRSEALPEGFYTVCIEVRDYNTNAVLGEGCTSVALTYFDPPVITQPADGQEVQSPGQQLVTFNWIPTGMAGKTQYQFELVDMTKNNLFNPNDAFLNPAIQTLYDKKGIVTNTLIYGLSEPPLTAGHTYALRIIAYDPQQKTLYKNAGVGPVSSFKYGGSMGGAAATNLPKPSMKEMEFALGGNKSLQYTKVKPLVKMKQLDSRIRVIGENGESCTEIRIRKKGASVYARLMPQGGGNYATEVEDSTYFMIVSEGLHKKGSVEVVLTFLDKNAKVLNEEEYKLEMDYGGKTYFIGLEQDGLYMSGYLVVNKETSESEVKDWFKDIPQTKLKDFKKHEGGFPTAQRIRGLWYADGTPAGLRFGNRELVDLALDRIRRLTDACKGLQGF